LEGDTLRKQVIHKGTLVNKWVSIDGKLYDADGKEQLLSDNGNGYLSGFLYSYRNEKNQPRSKREYIHRLVASAFLENPENLPQVNHKDCNKSNNHVNNLEWSDGPKNIAHSHENGRMSARYNVGAVIHLTTEEVKDVYRSVKLGLEGVAEAARRIGRSRTTVSSIMNKRSRSDITDLIDRELEK
jgi:hypothetical protein